MTDKTQNEEPPTVTKKRRTTKGSSRITELLDQVDAVTPNQPADLEPADDDEDGEPPITGRQRGAKNYTLGELTLLNKCMEAAVPIGPKGITEAFKLYNRIAKEKGWTSRREKALRQKWEKVKEITHTHLVSISPLQRSKPHGRNLGRKR